MICAKNHSTRHGRFKPPSFESLWDSSELQRTVTRHEAWQCVAEEHSRSKTQLRVAQVGSVAKKPAKVMALLKAWAPVIGRSQPQYPFILGDNIVVVRLPIGREATQEVPFVGIPVDQHTLIGVTEPERQRFYGEPGKAEVVRMSGVAVDRVCERIAQSANIVAASSAVRAARFGMAEYERRLKRRHRLVVAEPLDDGLNLGQRLRAPPVLVGVGPAPRRR